MAYTLTIDPSAQKQLAKLDRATQRRVASVIDDLAETPRPSGVRKIQGAEDLYRIRVGDYRVIYRIVDRKLVVLIVRIAHRRDAYR